MKEKILTLIIPAYNMEKYLDRCLSSLVVNDESMGRFEALVINDGSKDKTSEIGHRFEAAYPNTFRVIDKENGHYGSCVNRGLAEAKGTFVKILDADDSFDNEVFKEFLLFLSSEQVESQADLILSDFNLIEEGGGVIPKRYDHYDGVFSPGDVTDHDSMEWFIHGLTYRLSCLQGINYQQTEGIAYTDQEWTFKPIEAVSKMYKFNAPLYNYIIGRPGQSVSEEVQAKNLWMELKAIKSDVEAYCRFKDSLPLQNRKFAENRLSIMVSHIYQLYLITYRASKSHLSDLREFDSYLNGISPEIYQRSGGYSTRIAGFKFYPIKNWRDRRTLCLAIQSILYAIADLKNKFFQ